MGNIGGRWEGYETQLLADTTLQCYFVPNSEEEGFSPVIRNPISKDGYLGYLKKGDIVDGTETKKEEDKEKEKESSEELDTGYKLYKTSVEKYKDSEFIGYRPFVDENDLNKRGDFQWMSYGQFDQYVLAFGNGLQSLELNEKVCIGIYASNRPEWYAVHMANLSQSFQTTALYDTLGPEAVAYILRHSETPVVVCEKNKLKDLFKAIEQCKKEEGENEEEMNDEKKDKEKEKKKEKEVLRFGLKYVIQMDFDERYNNKHEQVTEEDKRQAQELGITLLGLSEIFAKV